MHRLAPLVLLSACAPSIADIRLHLDEAQLVTEDPETTGARTPLDVDTGDTAAPSALPTWTTTLDASDHEAWVYVDLAASEITNVDGPWTLALQRYQIAVNGGSSGAGGAEVAWLDGAASDPLDVPTTGWVTDAPDADDDGVDELALAEWYAYDGTTHVLSPQDRRWWVRTPSATFSLVFQGYYDDAGTSGFVSFEAVQVDGGAP